MFGFGSVRRHLHPFEPLPSFIECVCHCVKRIVWASDTLKWTKNMSNFLFEFLWAYQLTHFGIYNVHLYTLKVSNHNNNANSNIFWSTKTSANSYIFSAFKLMLCFGDRWTAIPQNFKCFIKMHINCIDVQFFFNTPIWNEPLYEVRITNK